MPDATGEVSCVGCGRCITACVPKIANPVEVFNKLWGESNMTTATKSKKAAPTKPDMYRPMPPPGQDQAHDRDGLFFEVKLDSGKDLGHKPGQFVEVSLPGIGEAPISVSSSPTIKGVFQMVIRRVGNVTSALHRLKPGDKLGIRGPFGTDFPVPKDLKGKTCFSWEAASDWYPCAPPSNTC